MRKSYTHLRKVRDHEDSAGIADTAADIAQEMSAWIDEKRTSLLRHGCPRSQANSILLLAIRALRKMHEMGAVECFDTREQYHEQYDEPVKWVLKRMIGDTFDALEKHAEPPKSSGLTVRKATKKEMEQRPTAALGLDEINAPPSTFPMQGLKKK